MMSLVAPTVNELTDPSLPPWGPGNPYFDAGTVCSCLVRLDGWDPDHAQEFVEKQSPEWLTAETKRRYLRGR